ncbi:MAG: hypothetical protein SFW62_00755 [Alphaproteobacteria bacterium]|nr:hypothetical protein [Alphaproteobacteria bacterium]
MPILWGLCNGYCLYNIFKILRFYAVIHAWEALIMLRLIPEQEMVDVAIRDEAALTRASKAMEAIASGDQSGFAALAESAKEVTKPFYYADCLAESLFVMAKKLAERRENVLDAIDVALVLYNSRENRFPFDLRERVGNFVVDHVAELPETHEMQKTLSDIRFGAPHDSILYDRAVRMLWGLGIETMAERPSAVSLRQAATAFLGQFNAA